MTTTGFLLNLPPPLESESSSYKPVANRIRVTYGRRCAICLSNIPKISAQFVFPIYHHPLYARKYRYPKTDLVSAEYENDSDASNFPLCAGCYQGFFLHKRVALSLPIQVLDYILNYLKNTPLDEQLALYEVFDLLQLAKTGADVPLPDPTPILPYIGLFSLVTLSPSFVSRRSIPTEHLPNLSIIQNDRFTPAPDRTHPMKKGVARIFDVLAVKDDLPPTSPGKIPLSPKAAKFKERRYWKLPLSIAGVLAGFANRIGNPGCRGERKEITRAREVSLFLIARRCEIYPIKLKTNSSYKDYDLHDREDSQLVESRSDIPRLSYYGAHLENWEVASSFSALSEDESVRTRSPCDDSPPGSDSESDDPMHWAFGPSYSANSICYRARGISLSQNYYFVPVS